MNKKIEDILQRIKDGKITKQEALIEIRNNHQRSAELQEKEISLSVEQNDLWVQNQLEPHGYAYNVPCAFAVEQELDEDLLQRAIQDVIQSNVQLHCQFVIKGDKPVQVENKQLEFVLERETCYGQTEDQLIDRLKEYGRKPFKLDTDLLVRGKIFRTDKHRKVLLLVFHHIVIDGFSLTLIMEQIQAVYDRAVQGDAKSSLENDTTYFHFISAQKEMLSNDEGNEHREFWKNLLGAQVEPLDLYKDKPVQFGKAIQAQSVAVELDNALVEQLTRTSFNEGISLYTLMMSAFMILLHRHSGQEEIVVGSPFLGRSDQQFDTTVGLFANMLPVKGVISGEGKAIEFMKQVHETVLRILDHSQYPLSNITNDILGNKRGSSKLFDVTFHFQNWFQPVLENKDNFIFSHPVPQVFQEGESEFGVEVFHASQKTLIIFGFNENVFFKESMKRMLSQYVLILQGIADNTHIAIEKINMLSEQDKHLMLHSWNNTVKDFPACPVYELIEEQCEKTPERIAVLYEGKEMTYGVLQTCSNQIAAYLHHHGIGKGDFVGIYVEPDENLPAIVLGILKSGAGFVPFDNNTPTDRLSYMIEDTKLKMVICNCSLPDGLEVDCLRIKPNWETEHQYLSRYDFVGESPVDIQSIAYIIYTSGSTGKPKGAQITHENLTNVICSMIRTHNFTEDDCIWGLTTICFDIVMVELFMPLVAGGKIEIIPLQVRKDGRALRRHIENTKATYIQATPVTWQMLISAGWDKRGDFTAITAGEALTRDLADKLLDRCSALWNQYGPTENTVYTTVRKIEYNEKITIGFPVDNNQLYILDKNMEMCPLGVAGELYIGGTGVFHGYINKPKINDRSLVYHAIGRNEKERLYRTGDLVRYVGNGDIDYIGRIDNQIKMRGYRIELGEIETAITKNTNAKVTTVVVQTDKNGHKRLVAWIIPEDDFDRESDSAQYRHILKKWLPEYMIPYAFYFVKEYPYTLSKKIDRKKLSEWSVKDIMSKYGYGNHVPEKSGKAKQSQKAGQKNVDHLRIMHDLRMAIAEVVGLDISEIEDNTHLGEYGYDSIYFTTLSIKLSNQFKTDISPAVFYEYSTASMIAEYMLKNGMSQLIEMYSDVREETEYDNEAVSADNQSEEYIPKWKKDIAIIGMHSMLPHSRDSNDFFQKLCNGHDFIERIEDQRWNANGQDKMWASFIENVDHFDAPFFKISRREAELMDPQQRILLENVWKTIESAGYRPSELSGKRVAVFIGVTGEDYVEVMKSKGIEIEPYSLSGAARTIVANRVSFMFNFIGPSQSIDTACSSSLIAVHRGIRALRDEDCELAVVGGVNLLLDKSGFEVIGKTGMLSADGKCKTFDKSADGYVRGEGVVTMLLKSLENAEKDRDYILAVIKGSAENHGGRTNSLTAPNAAAQTDLIVRAIHDAGISPSTISYIETHGTGTSIGDPIEINALKRAFQETVQENKHYYCGLGSVKSNIGHLESAAGIAGLFKMVLCLQNKVIPGNLHVNEVNEYISLKDSPFYIVDQTKKWEPICDEHGQPLPRRAGVSSFGFGGSNAHIVLEEYINNVPFANDNHHSSVFVCSAKTKEALKDNVSAVYQWFMSNPEIGRQQFRHILYTFQTGRESFSERVAIVCHDSQDLLNKLNMFIRNVESDQIYTGTVRGRQGNHVQTDSQERQKAEPKFLAAQFVGGVHINWDGCYQDKEMQKVPCVTYQFQPYRYWVSNEQGMPAVKTPKIENLINGLDEEDADLEGIIHVLEEMT